MACAGKFTVWDKALDEEGNKRNKWLNKKRILVQNEMLVYVTEKLGENKCSILHEIGICSEYFYDLHGRENSWEKERFLNQLVCWKRMVFDSEIIICWWWSYSFFKFYEKIKLFGLFGLILSTCFQFWFIASILIPLPDLCFAKNPLLF